MPPTLHEACQPLSVIIGEWHGSGAGQYPGIAEFEYQEQIIVSHVGKPFLTYSQKTKNSSDGQPLHSEQGFLRIIDDKNLEMVVAQPTGIVEVHSGFYASNPNSCVMDLHSTHVAVTATAKPVEQVHRLLRIADDTMTYDLSIAAVGKPIQQHLKASLERASFG
ncbi:MAG: fatty acid-binding-like protein [Acidimicrobiaceae bacterium]|nr:fatty acid-binding-like protein [Acidimicrobiaceae bacterium]|tara:strand:- start:28748 stop:29239 length:492 start_codon:yes stop_codon:yes gene_type:complete